MLRSHAFRDDTFRLVNLKCLLEKKSDLFVASIVVWRSYFSHSCCQIPLTLFCLKFTVVVIYGPNSGKTVVAQSVLVLKKIPFSMSASKHCF